MHDTDHVRTPDTLAQGSLGTAAGALATATRRLAAHSLSANTPAAYSCALRQFDTWRGAAPATDATLAAYLGFLFEQGRAPAVLFQGGLRRADAAALEWRDVAPATTAGAILVTVRRSKTDQEGTAADVRYLKSAAAAAVLALRPADPAPTARVFGGRTPQQLGRRFTAAAAGLHGRLTAHSGRVGLASELTARGASTTDVMLAGAWKTARMVAHYSAGATAELGAVARYL